MDFYSSVLPVSKATGTPSEGGAVHVPCHKPEGLGVATQSCVNARASKFLVSPLLSCY